MEEIVVRAARYGQGVFVSRSYKAGETIMTLSGPIIDFQATVDKGTRECDALQIHEDRYLDLEEPCRFINHSCRPNCGIRGGKYLVALYDLAPEEEVSYDYSTTMDEQRWTLVCQCGEADCRGVIKDFVTLPSETQQRYLDLFVVMPFIREKYHL